MKILIKRNMARGDVLLALPIVQWFAKNNPDAQIDFLSSAQYSGALENNPYCNVVTGNINIRLYDRVIDLTGAYERNPEMHIVEAYAKEAGIDPKELTQPEMFPEHVVPYSTDVIIHAARSWKNRTWSEKFWETVARGINGNVTFVGSNHDMGFSGGDCSDLRGRLTLTEVQSVINNSKCFIGSDSGIIHVASTTQTPIVGLYSCAKAEYRRPWGRNEFIAVEPAIDCYGCLHRQPAPVTYVDCPAKRNYECVRMITPDMVIEAYKELMG